MLSLPPSVRILLAREPADMRKGFDGLSHLVQSVLREDPLSGHLFVFRNRRGDRIKLLLWDSDGFLIVYKRLEKGMLPIPCSERHRGNQRDGQSDRPDHAARWCRSPERQATTTLRSRVRIDLRDSWDRLPGRTRACA